jgi:hypothetical protein
MTNLDSGEAHEPRLLILEPLVNKVRVVTVDVRLLHKRKVHSVIELAERCDGGIVTRLLAAKLLSTVEFYIAVKQ